jgi:hypothetical protein
MIPMRKTKEYPMFYYYLALESYDARGVQLAHEKELTEEDFTELCRSALRGVFNPDFEYILGAEETAEVLLEAREMAEEHPDPAINWTDYYLEQARKTGYGEYLDTCLSTAVEVLCRNHGFKRVTNSAYIWLNEELAALVAEAEKTRGQLD